MIVTLRTIRCLTVVVPLLGLVLVVGCGQTESKTDHTPKPGPQSTHSEPEIKTTATDLVKEFIADDKAALAKYKGKVVEVEGIVEIANKVVGDGKAITIAGVKKKPEDVLAVNVGCSLAPAAVEKAWWLGKGQKVKAVGEVYFYQPVLGVMLQNVTIKEVDKSPTPKVTAKELTEAYAKDGVAASKKYENKEAIVEGVVAGTDEANGFSYVKLEGADSATVKCTVKKEEKDHLKKGDKVTIKGDVSLYDAASKTLTVNSAFVLK